MKRVGLVGARGYTGGELLGLIAGHPDLSLEVACSSTAAGKPVRELFERWPTDLRFTAPDPAALAGLDAVVLALPNDNAAPFVNAIANASPETVIVDLSADHRFDDAWTYGLPERNRAHLANAHRIANPGCYATGMQLALAPLLDVLEGEPVAFGVSGYSGAGTKPSRKNDPDVLRDNLLPYALTDHVHEREVTRQLGTRVRFHPHVAPWFRGISLTISAPVSRELTTDAAHARLADAWNAEPLIDVTAEPPEVRDVQGTHRVRMGGVAVHEGRLVVISTLDNLLKGAATQALQNLNLALGLRELDGISLS